MSRSIKSSDKKTLSKSSWIKLRQIWKLKALLTRTKPLTNPFNNEPKNTIQNLHENQIMNEPRISVARAANIFLTILTLRYKDINVYVGFYFSADINEMCMSISCACTKSDMNRYKRYISAHTWQNNFAYIVYFYIFKQICMRYVFVICYINMPNQIWKVMNIHISGTYEVKIWTDQKEEQLMKWPNSEFSSCTCPTTQFFSQPSQDTEIMNHNPKLLHS